MRNFDLTGMGSSDQGGFDTLMENTRRFNRLGAPAIGPAMTTTLAASCLLGADGWDWQVD